MCDWLSVGRQWLASWTDPSVCGLYWRTQRWLLRGRGRNPEPTWQSSKNVLRFKKNSSLDLDGLLCRKSFKRKTFLVFFSGYNSIVMSKITF